MSIETYFLQILKAATRQDASDVHLTVGCPVRLRIAGKLEPFGSGALGIDHTTAIAEYILERSGRVRPGQLSENPQLLWDQDCSFGAPGIGRFRVNICRQRGTCALVLRTIPSRIPTIEDLRLPRVVDDIAMEERGLVLITGMTGSGKSTTLATMIGLINARKHCKVVTIEDPIEFVHKDDKASMMQREVGGDTTSFARAMRAALRQDPDVILVGEMRDEETVDTALKAAETGHLVLSTLHTTDAPKSLNRLISFVVPAEQGFMRLRLADSLKAIISQRLLRGVDEHTRLPAVEIMRTTESIKECIVNPEKTNAIIDYVRAGRDQYGMQTFDQHLMVLLEEGLISEEVAKAAATSASDFERNLVFV